MKLRSIELALPDSTSAASWMVEIWGLSHAQTIGKTHYLRGTGSDPYLVAFRESEKEFVQSTTFVGSQEELIELKNKVTASGWPCRPELSADPGGGSGFLVELPEGIIFRFLTGAKDVLPLPNATKASKRVSPVRLTHVVFNAIDAELMADAVVETMGFQVSDRTKGMVFVRCNELHHSTAFARAGFPSLNHIAFEMEDLDAVMRGIGWMRDNELKPAWGPGRHGPGDNVYAYFIAPFGPVVEYSTAVEKVSQDYAAGEPEDWTWPDNRIDQWGISDKDFGSLREAEQRFRCFREWEQSPL